MEYSFMSFEKKESSLSSSLFGVCVYFLPSLRTNTKSLSMTSPPMLLLHPVPEYCFSSAKSFQDRITAFAPRSNFHHFQPLLKNIQIHSICYCQSCNAYETKNPVREANQHDQ
ncbi:hypothetical protein Dsin_026601 [Dipteronia sinensis]|uniref:Uncharacterized protein n=1 Tax=Dipteronia sinensis TaxID=43782 RepID=A0AAD9ZYM2_9ROSI|nr:hypothetical protein Dsin_026601 [Dipteronia sinensis]